jgi:dihydrofolate reductase
MAEVTLTQFLSLDGVVQGPGGPEEDTSGDFDLGGWVVPYVQEEMVAWVSEFFAQADGFLLGRRTYEIFAAYWPHVSDEDDPVVAKRLNSLPKYVASRTLGSADWHNSTLLGADVAKEVAELKRQPGRELQIHGSSGLAQTLMAHELIDEYRLIVYPVVLGKGKRLFADGALPTAMKLTRTETSVQGLALHVYRPQGRPTFGSFDLDQ